MPKGWSSPVANFSIWAALPLGPSPRSTNKVPAPESLRKRSPLGAVRMRRGIVNVPLLRTITFLLSARCMGAESPPAYRVTLKPAGAIGQASAGRGITWGVLLTASSGLGWGKSARVILRRTPGCCWFQSANAARPVMVCWAGSAAGRSMVATSKTVGEGDRILRFLRFESIRFLVAWLRFTYKRARQLRITLQYSMGFATLHPPWHLTKRQSIPLVHKDQSLTTLHP